MIIDIDIAFTLPNELNDEYINNNNTLQFDILNVQTDTFDIFLMAKNFKGDVIRLPIHDCKPWEILQSIHKTWHILKFKIKFMKKIQPNESNNRLAWYTLKMELGGNLTIGQCFSSEVSESLEILITRSDKAWDMVLPRESMHERDLILKSSSSVFSSFTLSHIFGACHMLRTGRPSVSSLESLSSTSKNDRIIQPPPDAKSREQLKSIYNRALATVATSQFCGMSLESVILVLQFLLPSEVRHMSRTCKFFEEICMCVVPGLKLRLFGHQETATTWMRNQERSSSMRNSSNVYVSSIRIDPALCGFSDTELYLDITQNKVTDIVDEETSTSGMLCDEPGLGKTITMLSLILRTLDRPRWLCPVTVMEDYVDVDAMNLNMEKHWDTMENIPRVWLIEEITKVMKSRLKEIIRGKSQCPEVVLIAMHYAVQHMRKTEKQVKTITSFVVFRNQCEDAIERIRDFAPVGSPIIDDRWWSFGSEVLYQCLDTSVGEILKRFSSSRSRKCSSRLAIEQKKQENQISHIPSNATLVIVPSVLLQHWEEQVKSHINQWFSKTGPGFFYFDDQNCRTPLPSPELLAEYHMVVITTERVTREERRDNMINPLQTIAWSRIVIDEGHGLDANSRALCQERIRLLEAKYRWVMTGTPAKETQFGASLESMLGSIRFLRVPLFSDCTGLKLYRKMIVRPLRMRHMLGFRRVVALLSNYMIRHTKLDVGDLPALHIHHTAVSLNDTERKSYNTIASYGQSSIILTNKIGNLAAGWSSSLLNPENYRHTRELVRNLRLACSGGGKMTATIDAKSLQETQQILANEHGASQADLRRCLGFLQDITRAEEIMCDLCNARRPIAFLMPCVHFICTPCFQRQCLKTENCPKCRRRFDQDALAALQPGFHLQWHKDDEFTVEPSKARYLLERIQHLRKTETNFKCIIFSQFTPVLDILGHHLWSVLGRDSIALCIGSFISELRKFVHGIGTYWKCKHCGSENSGGRERCSSVLVRCEKRLLQENQWTLPANIDETRQDSTIREIRNGIWVGDTFIEVESSLLIGGFQGLVAAPGSMIQVAGIAGSMRVLSTRNCRGQPETFYERKNLECPVLLLSREGSTGLDLSVASHVFLVDKIWDLSVEDQVISRAWRLGTVHKKVIVEQLYSSGTVEEEMYDYTPTRLQDNDEDDSDSKRSRGDFSKMLFLLEHLQLVETVVSSKRKIKSGASQTKRVCFADQMAMPLVRHPLDDAQ